MDSTWNGTKRFETECRHYIYSPPKSFRISTWILCFFMDLIPTLAGMKNVIFQAPRLSRSRSRVELKFDLILEYLGSGCSRGSLSWCLLSKRSECLYIRTNLSDKVAQHLHLLWVVRQCYSARFVNETTVWGKEGRGSEYSGKGAENQRTLHHGDTVQEVTMRPKHESDCLILQALWYWWQRKTSINKLLESWVR